jgi:phosphohistidine phosphatase
MRDQSKMSRHLLILRHAKSAWNTDAPSDFDRPLAKRGRKDAPRVGTWLHEQGIQPDLVLSSPAERAKQTTLAVLRELGIGKNEAQWKREIYGATAPELLEVLGACPAKARTVLLVGHNPGLEDLLNYLRGDDLLPPEEGKLLPTGAVALVEMPEDWRDLPAGSARLISVTRPRDL